MSLELQNNCILQVKLEKNLGFAYVKYVDIRRATGLDVDFKLTWVYDFFSKDPLTNNENIGSDFFFSKRWLVNPLMLSSEILGTALKREIKVLLGPTDNENIIIPDFKEGNPFKLLSPEDFENYNWSVVHYFEPKRIWPVKYKYCQHLGDFVAYNFKGMRTALTLLYLRKAGIKINDIYSNSEMESKYMLPVIWSSIKNSPWLSDYSPAIWFKMIGS